MVKIGVISDSHGNLTNLQDAVCKLDQLGVDAIFHLGDYVRDAKKIHVWFNRTIYSVKGNCDQGSSDGKKKKKISFDNKIVYATHGHLFNVKNDLDALFYEASLKKANVVLFGHTHHKLLEKKNGILLMNPGSLMGGRYSENPSYGIITINNNSVNGELFELS